MSRRAAVGKLGLNLLHSLLYRLSRPGSVLPESRSVLFVCKGNICRSVFAEHVMRGMRHGKGIRVSSRGLDVRIRAASPPAARSVAAELGFDLESHRSRQVEPGDVKGADLVIAMEYWQYRELVSRFPDCRSRIRLLREFAPFPHNLLCNIPDPFGREEGCFRDCFALIRRSLENACERHLFPGAGR